MVYGKKPKVVHRKRIANQTSFNSTGRLRSKRVFYRSLRPDGTSQLYLNRGDAETTAMLHFGDDKVPKDAITLASPAEYQTYLFKVMPSIIEGDLDEEIVRRYDAKIGVTPEQAHTAAIRCADAMGGIVYQQRRDGSYVKEESVKDADAKNLVHSDKMRPNVTGNFVVVLEEIF